MSKVVQVGGTHYGKGYNHWDYADAVNVPYLEGCASKYLTRWREKGGIEDLKKSISYLEKRIENWQACTGANVGTRIKKTLFHMFIDDNNVPREEAEILDLIFHWNRITDIAVAVVRIKDLIRNEEEKEDKQAQAEISLAKSREGC